MPAVSSGWVKSQLTIPSKAGEARKRKTPTGSAADKERKCKRPLARQSGENYRVRRYSRHCSRGSVLREFLKISLGSYHLVALHPHIPYKSRSTTAVSPRLMTAWLDYAA